MNSFKERLINQVKEIEKLISVVDNRLKKSVPNEAVISYPKRKNGYQYYLVDKDGRRKYIKKNNRDIVKRTYQYEYDQKAKKMLLFEVSLLKHFIKNYDYPAVKSVYEKMGEGKRLMIKPIYMTDEEFIIEWKNKFKKDVNSFPVETAFVTDNDETVRSKSEKILADMFNKLGIPYHYEPKVEISKDKYFYPDFALLCLKTRKTIYWEHFGLINDGEYSSKALKNWLCTKKPVCTLEMTYCFLLNLVNYR